MQSKVGRVFNVIAAILLFGVAVFAGQAAFEKVLAFRVLERIPLTSVMASTGGEVQLRGSAEPAGRTLSAPDTHTQTMYFRYLVEEKHKDSDGNTKWRKVRDERNAVNFFLRDSSGRALVAARPALSHIDWSIQRKHRVERGDRRYSEWRIDAGDTVDLFGWLALTTTDPEVSFTHAGNFLPIVSSFDGDKERRDIGWTSLLLLILSITALVFMCFFVVLSLAIHRVLVLLSLVTLSSCLLMLYYGWNSLENDVQAGYQRATTQYQRSYALLEQRFRELQLDVDDITAFDLREPQFAALTEADKLQLNGWRMATVVVRDRYLNQIDHFPENIYAKLNRLGTPPAFMLPDDQQQIALAARTGFRPTNIGQQIMLTLAGLAVMGLTAWFGFKLIQVKRMQENLPTVKAHGVVFGMTEVVGKLVPEDAEHLLVGPLSSQYCTWYHYKVQERRGSGKSARWVTIENDQQSQTFYCRDDSGMLHVLPEKAEIITKHRDRQRRGKRLYTETRLMPDDELYLLGSADIDTSGRGDTLAMRDVGDSPFIISNRPEKEVMMRKAISGMALLSFSISFVFACLLLIAAADGFSSLDYVLSAFAAPMFFVMLMTVILYNDIIFLRKRCDRAWANIQVSLKKRYDLVPRLNTVLQALMQHERSLQTTLSEWRTIPDNNASPEAVQGYIKRERNFINQLQVTVERYPQLKTDQAFQALHRNLTALENEIALIREGFNDAVAYYNTRIQQFPDIVLAKLGRFKRLSLLAFEPEAHSVPLTQT